MIRRLAEGWSRISARLAIISVIGLAATLFPVLAAAANDDTTGPQPWQSLKFGKLLSGI